MDLLINATSLRSAGGRSVAINFLSALDERNQQIDAIAYVPPNAGYLDAVPGNHVDIRKIPSHLDRSWLAPIVDQWWLPKKVRELDPDVVFSMGNMAIRVRHPQLLLFMWPYAIYPESPMWNIMSTADATLRRIKIAYFRWNLQYASALAVQTEAAKDRFRNNFRFESPVFTVPCAVSLDNDTSLRNINSNIFRDGKGGVYLLCLSRYYPHKNIDVFLPIAREIKRRQLPFIIITTVEPDQHPDAASFLKSVNREGLDDVIRNLGRIPAEAVPDLYDQVQGLLLPTLLESFSQTYIESMHYRVPVFTSDLGFARTVCDDAAYYFDPNDPDGILKVLERAFRNDEDRQRKVELGKQIAERNPDWYEVTDQYLSILQDLTQSSS